jgi:hypothetical protein
MQTAPHHLPATWSTSCLGDDAGDTPQEQLGLRDHLAQCTQSGSRWPLVALAADAVKGFVGPRLVTTLALGLAVLGAAWLIWS